ncbi:hypothetical protein D3C74_409260 [compost metagenome]
MVHPALKVLHGNIEIVPTYEAARLCHETSFGRRIIHERTSAVPIARNKVSLYDRVTIIRKLGIGKIGAKLQRDRVAVYIPFPYVVIVATGKGLPHGPGVDQILSVDFINNQIEQRFPGCLCDVT